MRHPKADKIFVLSLKTMAEWYQYHPAPGAVSPLDAITGSLMDVAVAFEKSLEGKAWIAPDNWIQVA